MSDDEKKYGPFEYDYISKIKSPSDAGATNEGNLGALGQDVKVLMNYADILWQGSSNNGNLRTNNRTLGDAYFYKTDQDCSIKDDSSGATTKRYIYINNIPKGIGGAKGLLPGMVEDLGAFLPNNYIDDIITAQPECMSVSLEVVDNDENAVIQTHYMALSDIKQINACDFPDKINPAFSSSDPKYHCKQGFKNIYKTKKNITKYVYLVIFILIIIFLVVRYH
jgi:hypothetical protein